MHRILSKLDFFINLFNNALHNKNITIFVGGDGITISALKKRITLEETYLSYELDDFNKQYQEFLQKYKNFAISFLLDTKNCKINRHILPIVSSIIKLNPVDKFIQDNYPAEDLVAYNVYNITSRESEIWNTLIATTKYTPPLTDLVEYVLQFHKYRGIYFFSLESSAIISKILALTNNQQYQDHFQVFVTILRSSSVKIVIKRKNNILHDLTFPVKLDRSDEFLKGTIEQLVTDQILYCKEYIARHNAETCIILLVTDNVKNIIKADENFCKPHKIITLTSDQLNLSIPKNNDYFQESAIINLTTKSNTYLAYNDQLNQYNKCNFINNFLFKPVLILITFLFVKLAVLQYNIIQEKSVIEKINAEYYDTAKTYREIITQYPKSYDLNNLVDLYTIKQLLGHQFVAPDIFIQAFFNLHDSQLNLRNFSMEIIDLNHENIVNSFIKVTMETTYISTQKAHDAELQKSIDQYLKMLKELCQDCTVTYELDKKNAYVVSGTYIEPIKFILIPHSKKSNAQ